MERVLSRPNLQAALKRVRSNKGSPGVDGMTVDELPEYLREHWPALRERLLAGRYQPHAVRRHLIAKSGGGVRTLGIPAVLDRFIQFAHCHCARCRKATGAAHASNLYLAPSQLTWLSGSESIARFDLTSAQSFAKWFCRLCGSPVPRLSRSGRTVVVPAGSLDDELSVQPRGRIFCASAARWACEGDALPRYAEYPDWW